MAAMTYAELADQALKDADAATLDNVRDRCLRSEAAWRSMAVRQDHIDASRAEREAKASLNAELAAAQTADASDDDSDD